MFLLFKSARWRQALKIGIGLITSVSVLPTTEAFAQQEDLTARINKLLLQVSSEEVQRLPKPSLNPASWSLPEYARTPSECVGDDTVGTYIADLFPQRRGRINAHVVSQKFLSATISKQDENSVDTIELSPNARDQLRTLLKLRLRKIEETETGRRWMFWLLGLPGITTLAAGAGIAEQILAWTIVGAETGTSVTVGSAASDEKDHLMVLADQLRSSTKLYRSVVVVKSSSGREYIRYQYAVRPELREVSFLRSCVFARH